MGKDDPERSTKDKASKGSKGGGGKKPSEQTSPYGPKDKGGKKDK